MLPSRQNVKPIIIIKSMALITIPATRWGTVNRLREFAHAQSVLCPVSQSWTLLADNWIYLGHRAIQVAKWIGKSG